MRWYLQLVLKNSSLVSDEDKSNRILNLFSAIYIFDEEKRSYCKIYIDASSFTGKTKFLVTLSLFV